MAKSLNKAILIGNVGKEVEVRHTSTGTPVTSFSLATSDSWKDKTTGQLQERTEWHNCVAWNRLAEICGEYLKKGSKVYLEGRIQNRSYDDKDGNKKYISEVVISDMLLLDSREGSSERAPANQSEPVGNFEFADASDENLPF